jgi:hypothetical protein
MATAVLAGVISVTLGCSSGSSPTSATTAMVVDVHGSYSGTYSIARCSTDGAFTGFCEGGGFNAGTTLPISLSLTQNQGAVTGNIMLGSVAGTFQGTVSGSTLTGSATFSDVSNAGVTVSTSISDWNMTFSGNARSGGFSIVLKLSGTSGSATLGVTITQLSR